MLARPLHIAATLLAALCLLLTASTPADAKRQRTGPDKVAKMQASFKAGKFQKRSGRRAAAGSRKKRRRPGANGQTAAHGTTGAGTTVTGANGTHVPRFGVFTDKHPYDGSVAGVDALQAKLGRDIEIVNWYQSWGGGDWVSKVQVDVIKAVTNSGRTPLLTWEPWDPAKGADQPQFRLRKIADGDFDAYIASWADGLRDIGADVYLRPMHEMNGTWYPWGAKVGDNSPGLYKQAWKRMHRIFAEHGATNVKWVWSPLNSDVAGSPMEDWFPGDEYVDVMAPDGYNWGSKHEEFGGWQTFEEVFADSYKRLTKLGSDPIWFAEVGSAPDGGSKSKWVRDMWKTAASWDRLDAIVWFDQNKEEDWSILPVASAFAR